MTPLSNEEQEELNRLEPLAKKGDAAASLAMFRILQLGLENAKEYTDSAMAMSQVDREEFLLRLVIDLTGRMNAIEHLIHSIIAPRRSDVTQTIKQAKAH